MGTLIVNNVGGHPESPNDLWRRQVVFRDLYERGVDWEDVHHNWIDLPERDFLVEQPVADVTILHFIPDRELGRFNCVGLFNISALHTIERWRFAVHNTFSNYVYVFGDDDEVSGKKLGALPGYSQEQIEHVKNRLGTTLYLYVAESVRANAARRAM
jgi:hypothetical protein